MIIRLQAQGLELTAELDKYVRAKLGRLERAVPRQVRRTAAIEVKLRKNGASSNRTCELLLKLSPEELRVCEMTQHVYASVDVAVADMIRLLRLRRQAHKSKRPRLFGRQMSAKRPAA